MTNSMRWSLTSLTALGLIVAGGAFVGCSSSSDNNTQTDSGTDTATDTSTTTDSGTTDDADADTGTLPDTASPCDGGADALADGGCPVEPIVADRKITLVHASPDAGPQYFCFGAGANKVLAKALFMGIPGADPTDVTKYSPFPYGAIIPLGFPSEAVPPSQITALENFTIYVWPAGATNGTSATVTGEQACNTSWTGVKADPTKYIEIPKQKVLAGTSTVLYATGCAVAGNVGTLPQCGGKALSLGYKQLDLTEPTFTGTGTSVAFHLFHASPFDTFMNAGQPVPGWQNADVYLMPMSGTNPAGTPQKIATAVKYGDLVSPATAFTLPAGAVADDTLLLVMPYLSATAPTPCVSGGAPTATCVGWTLPLKTSLQAYAALGLGGGLVDKTHQLLVVAGAPIPDPTAGNALIGFGDVSKP